MYKLNDELKCLIQKIICFFYRFLWIFRIDSKKIVCINFSGKGYGDSPKYIVEEILKRKLDFKIYWIYKGNIKKAKDFPNNVICIKKYTLRYFFCMATSKFWISNNRIELYVTKRRKQIYIQTWHGGLALKKIEFDAKEKLSKTYKETIKEDNKNISYLISNSNFCTKMYRNAFKYKGEILEYGTPRNDILINYNKDIVEKVKKYYKLTDEKILLYVPTFRNNYDKNPYDIDFSKLKKALEKSNFKWKIFIRLHPIIKNPRQLINNFDNYVNACDYSDIQELICASDLIITDYSSTMFEGMIANKPVVLYANDIDVYKNERGYYFDFEELPFELAKDNDELINIVSNDNHNAYISRYKQFSEKVGLMEEGKCSKSIVDLIINNQG